MVYPCFYYTFPLAAITHLYIVPYMGRVQGPLTRIRVAITYIPMVCAAVCPILHLLSTFLYAVQDPTEFMEKLVEDIGIIFMCYSEFLPGFLTISELIHLINDMKSKFSTVDVQGIHRLGQEEKWCVRKLCVTAFIAVSASESEYLFYSSEERVAKRTQIYQFKHGHNKVPINFYLLGIDVSDPSLYYIYLVILAYFDFALTGIAGFRFPTLGICSIHMRGQLDILIKYIDLIDNQQRDKRGHLKFYTNIVTGQYFTVDKTNPYKITVSTRVSKSRKECRLDTRDFAVIRRILEYNRLCRKYHFTQHGYYNPVYEEYFMKQIIQYHQFLLSIRERAQNYLTYVAIPTCMLMISLQSLCICLFLTSEAKFTYALIWILVNLHVAQLVQFSEDMEDLNRTVRAKIFGTQWYRKSARVRSMVHTILHRCNKTAHFSFHAGFIVYDRAMLLTLFAHSYRFLNWLLFVHKK